MFDLSIVNTRQLSARRMTDCGEGRKAKPSRADMGNESKGLWRRITQAKRCFPVQVSLSGEMVSKWRVETGQIGGG